MYLLLIVLVGLGVFLTTVYNNRFPFVQTDPDRERAGRRCLKMSLQVKLCLFTDGKRRFVTSARLFKCFFFSVLNLCGFFVFSVLSGAPAGAGSSGASTGQTGPEGGVDPQRHPGQPEGDAAEPTVQPHPDPAALYQTAPKPGEHHKHDFTVFKAKNEILLFN